MRSASTGSSLGVTTRTVARWAEAVKRRAAGLLNRALDPATQPPEIQAFLQDELDLLLDVIMEGMRVIDVGCGTGRHLILLQDRLRVGVGVDYEHSYVAEAQSLIDAMLPSFRNGDSSGGIVTGAHEVVLDESNLTTHLFGPRPYAEVLMAEDGGEPVGFALAPVVAHWAASEPREDQRPAQPLPTALPGPRLTERPPGTRGTHQAR